VTTAIDDRRYAFLDVDANVLIGDESSFCTASQNLNCRMLNTFFCAVTPLLTPKVKQGLLCLTFGVKV
jgi:hypothetical protein